MRHVSRLRKRLLASLCFFSSLVATSSVAQNLKLLKIDPPNWYAALPTPMLLIRGEGLGGAVFTLSDKSLHVERTAFSANGHWAQLWLNRSPAQPETVQLRASQGSQHAEAPYTFAARRSPGDGMAGFSPRDVMYLILTDRFADGDPRNDGPEARNTADSPEAAGERAKPKGWHGGDLRGIADHLDYLQSFGVTAVWPTPVYQNHSAVAYHGYHSTDYYSVDEHYGSLADLQALARALHAHGMKLVLDTVPNHVGPYHPWVTDEPAPDWFHGTAEHHLPPAYDFNALIDPHSPERDRLNTLHGWFPDVPPLPDMNTDSPTVSQYLRQNVIWWIEQTGADGLRYDTFPYVNREFWHELNFTLRSLYPHLTEVGEVSNGDPEVISAFAAGVSRGDALTSVDTGLYTPFDFPVYHATRDVFANGQPLSHLRDVLRQDYLYPHPERLVPFLGNHDESRFAGSVHDLATQKIAYAFLMTTRGTPQLYSGDEIAMDGGNDPDNRRDFPGGFPSSLPSSSGSFGSFGSAGFTAFSAAGRTGANGELFNWIAQLARLRRGHPALACGAEQVLFADKDTLVYTRYGTAGCEPGRSRGPEPKPSTADSPARPVLIALHRGDAAPIHVDLHATAAAGCTVESLSPGSPAATIDGDTLNLRLATETAIVFCR